MIDNAAIATQGDVVVRAVFLSDDEANQLFNSRVNLRQFAVVYLEIENKGSDRFYFPVNFLNKERVDVNTIYSSMGYSFAQGWFLSWCYCNATYSE